MKERWKQLLRLLHSERPLEDMRLYVEPPRSSAAEICEAFEADPTSFQKFLLVGARGGGKSTELREVERRLESRATLATIDLDASGVSPSAISAFDLLYISGLALLRLLPEAERKDLFTGLASAYADGDDKDLGNVEEALSGLQSFATAAGAFAAAINVATGLSVASAALGMASKGLRLLGKPRGFVAETSPQGRRLQAACAEITRAVRSSRTDSRPICVLVDGLEKMNGEASSRFDHMFCQTRLLADAQWIAAIAAPPCSLTKTHGARALGFEIQPVYGFDAGAESDRAALLQLLQRRFEAAAVDPARDVESGQLERIVSASGGLPRQVIQITENVVRRVVRDGAASITAAHVAHGIQKEAEMLGYGLTDEDFRILKTIHRTHRLPGDERAATLFANGRILAHPPAPASSVPRFVVHPLLQRDVEQDSDDDAG